MRAAAAALLLEAVHQQLLRVLADYWQTEDIGRAGERRGHSTGPGSINNCFTTAATGLQHQAVSTSQHFNISAWPQSTS